MMVGSLADQALAAWAGLGQLLSCLTKTESLEELSRIICVFSESCEARKSKKTGLFVLEQGDVLDFVCFLNSAKFASDIDRCGKWPRE